MRTFGRTLAAGALAFVLVAWAEGQQRPPFGGGGFGGARDLASLARDPSVRKELNITDEQVEKLPAAVAKAVGEVLDQKQLARLKQIELQQKGSQAYLDAGVQKQLGLSDEQKSNIKTILEDARKETVEAFKGGGGKGGFEKIASIRKEATEKVQGVLTADQKNNWKKLIGEEFKFERPGGGGDGKKFDFKKFDFKKKPKDDV